MSRFPITHPWRPEKYKGNFFAWFKSCWFAGMLIFPVKAQWKCHFRIVNGCKSCTNPFGCKTANNIAFSEWIFISVKGNDMRRGAGFDLIPWRKYRIFSYSTWCWNFWWSCLESDDSRVLSLKQNMLFLRKLCRGFIWKSLQNTPSLNENAGVKKQKAVFIWKQPFLLIYRTINYFDTISLSSLVKLSPTSLR